MPKFSVKSLVTALIIGYLILFVVPKIQSRV